MYLHMCMYKLGLHNPVNVCTLLLQFKWSEQTDHWPLPAREAYIKWHSGQEQAQLSSACEYLLDVVGSIDWVIDLLPPIGEFCKVNKCC